MKHEAKYIVSDIEIVVRNLQKEGYLRVTHNELMKRLPDPQRLTPNGAGKTTPAACIHHWAINSDGLPYCIKCKRMRGAPLS